MAEQYGKRKAKEKVYDGDTENDHHTHCRGAHCLLCLVRQAVQIHNDQNAQL